MCHMCQSTVSRRLMRAANNCRWPYYGLWVFRPRRRSYQISLPMALRWFPPSLPLIAREGRRWTPRCWLSLVWWSRRWSRTIWSLFHGNNAFQPSPCARWASLRFQSLALVQQFWDGGTRGLSGTLLRGHLGHRRHSHPSRCSARVPQPIRYSIHSP